MYPPGSEEEMRQYEKGILQNVKHDFPTKKSLKGQFEDYDEAVEFYKDIYSLEEWRQASMKEYMDAMRRGGRVHSVF